MEFGETSFFRKRPIVVRPRDLDHRKKLSKSQKEKIKKNKRFFFSAFQTSSSFLLSVPKHPSLFIGSYVTGGIAGKGRLELEGERASRC